MIRHIQANMNVIESMLYFWTATTEREKLNDAYLVSIANFEEMKLFYDDTFNAESVRKVLSAITNREMLNTQSKKERQFWNNNMYIMEDMELSKQKIEPLKQLQLGDLVEKLNDKKDLPYEEVEVLFIPANKEEYVIKGNKLLINFFMIQPDIAQEGELLFQGKNLKEYILERLVEMN